MPKVNVSFKENCEELNLYNEVLKSRDKSAFIKDAIKFYLDCKIHLKAEDLIKK